MLPTDRLAVLVPLVGFALVWRRAGTLMPKPNQAVRTMEPAPPGSGSTRSTEPSSPSLPPAPGGPFPSGLPSPRPGVAPRGWAQAAIDDTAHLVEEDETLVEAIGEPEAPSRSFASC